MLNNFNFADKSIKPEDLAANAFGYYCDDFAKLTDILTLKNNISEYYYSSIKVNEAPKNGSTKIISDNVNTLIEIFNIISGLLSCQQYIDLVNSDEQSYIKTQIRFLKDNEKECGALINLHLDYIKAYNHFFGDYSLPTHSVEYEKNLTNQFKSAKGYKDDREASYHELIVWSSERAEIGYKIVNQLKIFGRATDIKPAEMHKGLWDSVFKLYRDSLGEYKNSPIISPYYNFLLSKDNCIKGKLTYECGLTIKDDYKVTDFPEDVNTLLLYNPYNENEVQTLVNSANDLNIAFSIFGKKKDADYEEKQKIYNDLYFALTAATGEKPLEQLDQSGTSFVKTMFSKKNPK